jgi:hypothetical protein
VNSSGFTTETLSTTESTENPGKSVLFASGHLRCAAVVVLSVSVVGLRSPQWFVATGLHLPSPHPAQRGYWCYHLPLAAFQLDHQV